MKAVVLQADQALAAQNSLEFPTHCILIMLANFALGVRYRDPRGTLHDGLWIRPMIINQKCYCLFPIMMNLLQVSRLYSNICLHIARLTVD